MRHNVAGRNFSRTANQRKALLRGLVTALVEHQKIETTLARAKETKKIAEKLLTLALRGDLHAKRTVMSELPNRGMVVKLFDEIAPRFRGRNGGYLRIVQTRQRVNDRSQMAVLEFIDYADVIKKEGPKAKKEKPGKEEPKSGPKSEKG